MTLPVQPRRTKVPRPNTGTAPAPRFRRESWARFQLALDPLGLPRPLRSVERDL
jgi:hypothetical protein